MKDLPIANDMPYWKTSQSSIEHWIEKTEKLIVSVGGVIHTRIFGMNLGKEGILIAFNIEKDYFRIFWPVLEPVYQKDKVAAQRQAVTMLFYDTKARINRIQIFGPRVAFSDYLLLGGRTIAETKGEHSSIGNFLQLE